MQCILILETLLYRLALWVARFFSLSDFDINQHGVRRISVVIVILKIAETGSRQQQ